jgi:hypothetical protein
MYNFRSSWHSLDYLKITLLFSFLGGTCFLRGRVGLIQIDMDNKISYINIEFKKTQDYNLNISIIKIKD